MSNSISSIPGINPESAGHELTAVNKAIRGMYQQEIAKITFGIQQARPGVQEVMQHAMNGLYATRIQFNEKALPEAAKDNLFTLAT